MSDGKEIATIAGAVILPNLGGFVSNFYTRKAVKTWYKKLNFPPGRPADWVFAPMWTSLYCGMGYASYLVWKEGGGFNDETKLPLILYGSQLALNWAWSPIFFIKKDFKMAAIELGAVTAVAAACGFAFYKVNNLAGLIFLPYCAWLSYASYLNYGIFKRNKGEIKDE